MSKLPKYPPRSQTMLDKVCNKLTSFHGGFVQAFIDSTLKSWMKENSIPSYFDWDYVKRSETNDD